VPAHCNVPKHKYISYSSRLPPLANVPADRTRRTSLFAATRGDNTAMRPFAKLLVRRGSCITLIGLRFYIRPTRHKVGQTFRRRISCNTYRVVWCGGGELQGRSRKGDVERDRVRRFTCIAYSQIGEHLRTDGLAADHHTADVQPVHRQFRLADVVITTLLVKLDLRHSIRPTSAIGLHSQAG